MFIKKMKILSIIILLSLSFSAQTEERLCPEVNVKSQGEGHWPITEDAFTKQEAEKHWKVIQNIINGTIQDDDPEVYENAFMVVRGWLLKREVKRSKQFDNEFMKKHSLNEFCTFLKNNAYVRH